VTGFLSELGKRLAERWLTLLVLPGALWVGFAVGAVMLGHRHAFDVGLLVLQVPEWTRTTNEQVTLLAVLLGASAAVGLAAQAIGSAVERLALATTWRTWPRPWRWLAEFRVARRKARWAEANAEFHRLGNLAYEALVAGQRLDPGPRVRAYRRRERVAPECPDRPTWSGDRLNAVAVRVDRDLHLDLATVWPNLWLVLPGEIRAELTAARQSLTRGATLAGWAIMYAPLTVWWWPAVMITVGTAVAGRYRLRAAADVYADLVEAAARTFVGDLATKLGVPGGDALMALLHSQPPAPEVT
jgi:hypothetical protein